MEGSLFKTLVQQENHLKDVINNAIHEDTDMEIVSQDQQYLPCQKSLLSLFSPVISRLLSSVPSCASPTIFLPDFPASHIKSFLQILQYGQILPSQDLETELKFIHDVADALQISINDLSVVKVAVEVKEEQYNLGYVEEYEMKHEHFEEIEEKFVKNMFACELCPKMFARRDKLNAHENSHLGVKVRENSCELCDAKFTRKDNLVRHIKKYHSNGVGLNTMEQLEFQCDICPKSFKHKRYLTAHKHIHETPRYECSRCAKPFFFSAKKSAHEFQCKLVKEVYNGKGAGEMYEGDSLQ